MLRPLLILSLAGVAGAVDANPATYQAAVAALQPGDTLNLAAGTYAHDLAVSGLNGSAGAWITIVGPADGSAVFTADDSTNTVEITGSSFVAIANLTLDGQHRSAPFGISAKGGNANLTHDILIQGCTIRDYDGAQQTDGISTKCPTWNWIIRGNRILHAGTGMYLGNSDGSCPFVAGVIEGNLILEPIGYGMQVKWQLPRPSIAGMPTGPSTTIIRHNVLIKDDRASPDGDRPNLLVGGFPDSGAGSTDLYDIYGNFLYHNPRESLLQASGRVAIHDNLFVDVAGTAVYCVDHDLPLKLAQVYDNTIHAAGKGIWFGSSAPQGDAVVGNLVFAATPIGGAIASQHDNLVDSVAHAGLHVTNPSLTLGALDLYPLDGECIGPALDLSAFSSEAGYDRDFNGVARGFTYRGAYAGGGANPGWMPQAGLKPLPSDGGTTSSASTSTGTSGGTTGGGTGSPVIGGSGHSGCGLGSALGLLAATVLLARPRQRA
jgi:hypothetical protein